MLRTIEAGAPAGLALRSRLGSSGCEPGRGAAPCWSSRPGRRPRRALLLGLERAKLRGLPSGVELDRFSRRPLAEVERLALWRRWLVEQPRGWDESGRPGSIAYRDEELAPFRAGGPVFLYVGRYTAVKRLPLLISAHARRWRARQAAAARARRRPSRRVGGGASAHGARGLGNRQVFLAGWRPTRSCRRR